MEGCCAWTAPNKKKHRNTGSDRADLLSPLTTDRRSYEQKNFVNNVDRLGKNKYEYFMFFRV
jgi:hypothetical protein